MMISKEFNESKNVFTHRLLCNDDNKSKFHRYAEFIKLCNEKEKSFISEMIYNTIIHTYRCECSKEIYAFQNYMDLPLLLPENSVKITLNELLDNYFNYENIQFNDICDICKKICPHNWNNGFCTICGMWCDHPSWNNGVCTVCHYQCDHSWSSNGECTNCHMICSHVWEDGYCKTCNMECSHSWENGVCQICQFVCTHQYEGEYCMYCGIKCTHNFVDGECTICGLYEDDV